MTTRLERFLNKWRLWLFRGFAALAVVAIPLSHIHALQAAFATWHVFESLLVVLLVVTVETTLHAVGRLPAPATEMRIVSASESIQEVIRMSSVESN